MTGGTGSTTIVPYRNKNVATNGLLKGGMTRISEVIDGTSNTVAIMECAGRDERFVSQYAESIYGAYIGLRGRVRLLAVCRRRAPLLRWADPGSVRHLGPAQQQRPADERRGSLALNFRHRRQSGGPE